MSTAVLGVRVLLGDMPVAMATEAAPSLTCDAELDDGICGALVSLIGNKGGRLEAALLAAAATLIIETRFTVAWGLVLPSRNSRSFSGVFPD